MLVDPCHCARNRETAMSCPRKPRGRLVWTPIADHNGRAVGPAEVVTPAGERQMLIFGDEPWSHYSEGLARDHAEIRHLDFEVVTP